MKAVVCLKTLGILSLAFLSCGQNSSQPRESGRFQSDTCDSPDGNINCCFVNMPVSLSKVVTLAEKKEPGERMVINGTVFKQDGITPFPDVILYVYHTDHTGHYPRRGNETGIQKWHGHLHGWCQTDKQGRYEIHSIRPARYPDNTLPAHIHAVARRPGGSPPFYISDFVFVDDNLVTEKYLSMHKEAGGTGVVALTKNANGTWEGKRDIVLNEP